MHYQLLPLYIIGALFFLYTLVGILRDLWDAFLYEPTHDPMEYQDPINTKDTN